MSEAAGVAGLYSAIEESARLVDVVCEPDTVLPILTTFEDALPRSVIAFRVATDAKNAGEFNCRILKMPNDVDPYARALSNGLIDRTDHPVGALLADIHRACPIDSYGVDFGVVGGFQKTWTFFPAEEFQRLTDLAAIPSMPRALADYTGFFADRGLADRVSLIGIDYPSGTVNIYFGDLPDECLEPESVRSMHREIGLPDPSENLLTLAKQAFGIYVTLSWDSPGIHRISFSVLTPDAAALPVRLDPKIERFTRGFRYGADAPKIVYVALSSTNEEYYKIQSYFRWKPQVLDLMQGADGSGGVPMSTHKAIVEKYIDGVCRGDRQQALSCVTDDIRWDVYGAASARGKAELAGIMDNGATAEPPTHNIDRLIEEGDRVVVNGNGGVTLTAGGRLEFLFCDIFTFSGDAISQIECYQVILRGESPWSGETVDAAPGVRP